MKNNFLKFRITGLVAMAGGLLFGGVQPTISGHEPLQVVCEKPETQQTLKVAVDVVHDMMSFELYTGGQLEKTGALNGGGWYGYRKGNVSIHHTQNLYYQQLAIYGHSELYLRITHIHDISLTLLPLSETGNSKHEFKLQSFSTLSAYDTTSFAPDVGKYPGLVGAICTVAGM